MNYVLLVKVLLFMKRWSISEIEVIVHSGNIAEADKAEKDRTQSAERIHSLHTRLHQEAEKIRKWKTSTEIEIKEKVTKFKLFTTTMFLKPWIYYHCVKLCISIRRRKSYWKLFKPSILRGSQFLIYR